MLRDLCKDRTVHSIHPEASVHQAATLMTAHGVGALPVVHDDRLVGIFTERDLVNRVVTPRLDPELTTVSQVMSTNPKVITFEQTLCDALRLMQTHSFRHLPVVDGQRVVGIISLRDIPVEYHLLKERWDEAQRGHDLRKKKSSDQPTERALSAFLPTQAPH